MRFTDEPFDKIPAQVALISYFSDERPLRYQAGLVDWRLNGKLSQLLMEGKLSGAWQEVTLFPSAGKISAEKIVMLGLGSSRDMNAMRFADTLVKMNEIVSKLHATEALCHLPGVQQNLLEPAAVAQTLQTWQGRVQETRTHWIISGSSTVFSQLNSFLAA